MRKLQNALPGLTLAGLCKAFVRSHLDYVDILYDLAFNKSFHERLESIQQNTCYAITAATMGTSRDKLYQELGLEPLRFQFWYRKLCLFTKLLKTSILHTSSIVIPARRSSHTSRNVDSITIFNVKYIFYRKSFFPFTISEWVKLDPGIFNSKSLSIFRYSRMD